MKNDLRKKLRDYGIAVACVAVATAVWLGMLMLIGNRISSSFFLVAVFAACRYGGYGPGWLSLMLGTIPVVYTQLLFNRFDFAVFCVISVHIILGIILVFVTESVRTARRTAEQNADDAIKKHQLLEREAAERKRVEAELQASQDRFLRFMDNGPFAALMKDEGGKYIYVNKFLAQSLRRTQTDFLGKTDWDIFPHDLAKGYVEDDRRALRDDTSVQIEENATTTDGTVQRWSTIKFPVQDGQGGRLLGCVSVNVTEIREAEQQAKFREAQLLLALEAGRMGIWSWNLVTNQVLTSETYAAIHGRAANQTAVSIDEAITNIHPDDRQLVQDAIDRAMKGIAPERVVYRVIWPDDSVHWLEGIGRVIGDESGKPERVVGVCTDITERKRAEFVLREAEERFRFLAMHAPIGIAQSDAEGRTCFVNPKWCEFLGASPDEVMGYGWQNFLHPDDRARLVEEWQADIANKKTHKSSEYRIIRKDGTIRWASSTASLLHDALGNSIAQIGVTEDITESKAISDALRESEDRFRQLATYGPVGIVEADAQGRCTFVNRRWCEMAGISEEEALGEGWRAAAHPDDRDRVAKEWYEAVQAGREFVGESRLLKPSGEVVWVHFCSVAIKNEDGTLRSYISTVVDISERKEAHDALKHEQALLRNLIEVQEREKQFLCHEFHDGLIQYAVASLMSLEGYQNQHAAAESSPIIDMIIGNLRKGVDDGRRVIRGIRTAVLDDSGLDAAMEDLIDQYSTSGILVKSNCDPAIRRLPESVQTTIYRVVQEALSNARKHSGTDVVRIELKKVNGDLHLDIRDFGCGFDVLAARKKGFGLLGMSERVRLLGGECQIQSEHDDGTRIFVRLPIPPSDVLA